MVYVINIDGVPLMPTERHGMVRRWLRDKKAKVVKRTPFNIQLLFKTTDITQPLTLGVDAGSKNVGLSVTSAMQNAQYPVLQKNMLDEQSHSKQAF